MADERKDGGLTRSGLVGSLSRIVAAVQSNDAHPCCPVHFVFFGSVPLWLLLTKDGGECDWQPNDIDLYFLGASVTRVKWKCDDIASYYSAWATRSNNEELLEEYAQRIKDTYEDPVGIAEGYATTIRWLPGERLSLQLVSLDELAIKNIGELAPCQDASVTKVYVAHQDSVPSACVKVDELFPGWWLCATQGVLDDICARKAVFCGNMTPVRQARARKYAARGFAIEWSGECLIDCKHNGFSLPGEVASERDVLDYDLEVDWFRVLRLIPLRPETTAFREWWVNLYAYKPPDRIWDVMEQGKASDQWRRVWKRFQSEAWCNHIHNILDGKARGLMSDGFVFSVREQTCIDCAIWMHFPCVQLCAASMLRRVPPATQLTRPLEPLWRFFGVDVQDSVAGSWLFRANRNAAVRAGVSFKDAKPRALGCTEEDLVIPAAADLPSSSDEDEDEEEEPSSDAWTTTVLVVLAALFVGSMMLFVTGNQLDTDGVEL